MKENFVELYNLAREKPWATAITLGVLGLLGLGLLEIKSENQLTEAKAFMADRNAISAVCGEDYSQCYLEEKALICDGKNTLNTADDECEYIPYLGRNTVTAH